MWPLLEQPAGKTLPGQHTGTAILTPRKLGCAQVGSGLSWRPCQSFGSLTRVWVSTPLATYMTTEEAKGRDQKSGARDTLC